MHKYFHHIMRRALVIYDFAPDPCEFPNTWGNLFFLFYQCTVKVMHLRCYCNRRKWKYGSFGFHSFQSWQNNRKPVSFQTNKHFDKKKNRKCRAQNKISTNIFLHDILHFHQKEANFKILLGLDLIYGLDDKYLSRDRVTVI
jgi:hypothetical protein